MKSRWFSLSIVVAVGILAGVSLPVHAQDKDAVIEGQVKQGVHKFTLATDAVYQVEVKGEKFRPDIDVPGGFYIPNKAPFQERNTFRGLFLPPTSQEYTLVVRPGTTFEKGKAEKGLLDYTLTLRTMKLDPMPVLKKDESITTDDPKYATKAFGVNIIHHKAYPVSLKAGQIYVVDMVAAKVEGNKLRPRLVVEAPNKTVVGSAIFIPNIVKGFPDVLCRVLLTPTVDGEYRMIAGGASDGSTGAYTLTLLRTKGDAK